MPPKSPLGMGAEVSLLDINLDRLRYLDDVLPGKLRTLYSSNANIARVHHERRCADRLGVDRRRARSDAGHAGHAGRAMPKGSVIVDVAVDQGGLRRDDPRHHTQPSPPSRSTAFCIMALRICRAPCRGLRRRRWPNATLPYALKIADLGLRGALESGPRLAQRLGIHMPVNAPIRPSPTP